MWLTLDRSSQISLMGQIYGQIKKMILNGKLISGQVLPPTRVLATELQISRNTVLTAYEQLMAEGFLEGRQGSGTVVAKGIETYKAPNPIFPIPKNINPPSNDKIINFRLGLPDISLFPKVEWGKLYQQTIVDLPAQKLSYHEPEGVYSLRCSIANYLFRVRGIECSPDNIMITSGSTQGLSIAANILYTDGAMALMEDPTHPGLRHVISNQGYGIQGIPADEKGLNTALLTSVHSLSFIYVTPSHQYPLGGVLPIQRRLALIQYASDQNCYLIEDDYDSEFRYEGQPIHSLYELNPNKVIYMGSFSKLLAPALRLGYLILPDHLIEFYKNRKKYTDLHTEVLTQYTLSAFMNNGGLEKHIGKMKKLYSRKRAHVIYQLDRYFHGQFEIRGQAAGLHLIVHFKHLTITNELLNILYENNVQLYGVSSYEFQHFGFHNHDILVGYAHLSFEEITLGIQILNQILTLTK